MNINLGFDDHRNACGERAIDMRKSIVTAARPREQAAIIRFEIGRSTGLDRKVCGAYDHLIVTTSSYLSLKERALP